MKITNKIIIGIFAVFFMNSCFVSRIEVYDDTVFATKRIKFSTSYNYYEVIEKYTPLINLNKSVLAEISNDGTATYKVFDVFTLSNNSYSLDKNVYLIIDNEVFKINIENEEYDKFSSFSENRQDVLTADSTKVSVVTGYTTANYKLVKFTYTLENNVVEKIKNSQNVQFRYYSGADMLTINIKDKRLETLKKALNMH